MRSGTSRPRCSEVSEIELRTLRQGGELVGVVRADLVPHDLEIREAADHLGDAVADGAEVDGEDLGRVRGRGDSAGVPEIAEVEVWEDGLGVGPVEENVAGSGVSVDDSGCAWWRKARVWRDWEKNFQVRDGMWVVDLGL